MHEMGIALEIIDIVKTSIPPDMAHARVTKVHLKIGKLSAVVPKSLTFCMEIAAKGTVLENAELDMEEIPVVDPNEPQRVLFMLTRRAVLARYASELETKKEHYSSD